MIVCKVSSINDFIIDIADAIWLIIALVLSIFLSDFINISEKLFGTLIGIPIPPGTAVGRGRFFIIWIITLNAVKTGVRVLPTFSACCK